MIYLAFGVAAMVLVPVLSALLLVMGAGAIVDHVTRSEYEDEEP